MENESTGLGKSKESSEFVLYNLAYGKKNKRRKGGCENQERALLMR
jgi:hypothetical protein